MTPKRIVWYNDPLHDDFAGTNIHAASIGPDYPFAPKSLPWRVGSAALWLLAVPVVCLINRLWFGVRIRNRKALRGIRGGCFLYGNHTRAFPDATLPSMLALPHRAYVVCNADGVSLPVAGGMARLLGALPLPDTLAGQRPFIGALERRIGERALVAIYPEAHIWPFYTGVRPFPSASFVYPVRCGCPVVACCATYRKRLLSFLPPAMTYTLSEPVYPDPALTAGENREKLRAAVYGFLTRQSGENQVEYWRYEPSEETDLRRRA